MIASTFELHLATPIIITNNMDESEFIYEFEKMKYRSKATREFVAGRLDVGDFLDVLDECGADIDNAMETWKNGGSYMV